VASVFIVESVPVPLVAAASLPLEGLRAAVELLSVVLGEPIEGLGEGDVLVLGGVLVLCDVDAPGDVVVSALLGGVVVVESGGIVVAFDDGWGRVLCAVVVELESSVVDWA
jgi:hypothetical protein